MRVAVVDIGTNSTRLLVAEVREGRVAEELHRESVITRLGQGVDATGVLADEAMERVFTVLGRYRALIDEHGATRTIAVLTSAVRDAANGAQFTAAVRDRFGLDARTIPGAEEAALSFLGATAERDAREDGGAIVVIDIGGGSTELIVGRGRDVQFFVSLQAGVVRMTERHLAHDPPRQEELVALGAQVAAIVEQQVPPHVRQTVTGGVAVAGTATQTAAIDQALEPYDPARVHGHVVRRANLQAMLDRLAAVPLEERRRTPGLHPDRAPTIVAGIVILLQVLDAFALDAVEVSEHDILRGAALEIASAG